jgi:hypothetical protein
MKKFKFEITITEQDVEGDEFWEQAIERDGSGIAELTDAIAHAIDDSNLLINSDNDAKDVIKLVSFLHHYDGYYVTSDGKKGLIKHGVQTVNLSHSKLIHILLPQTVKRVKIEGNQIEDIMLPKSVKELCCDLTLFDKHFKEWMKLPDDVLITALP